MRLLNPGVGELSDRLSILALKILFGEDGGKDIAHFKTEQSAILTQIRTRTLNGKWFEAYTTLAAVNAALWHAEDDLRQWRGCAGGGSGIALDQIATPLLPLQVAFRIQALNDRRASLIESINRAAGEQLGSEKL